MSIETTKELAAGMLKLFGPNGEHWTQGRYAVDEYNLPIEPSSPSAARWCLAGAIHKFDLQRFYSGHVENPLVTEFRKKLTGNSIVGYNDTHKWPEVKSKLEEITNE